MHIKFVKFVLKLTPIYCPSYILLQFIIKLMTAKKEKKTNLIYFFLLNIKFKIKKCFLLNHINHRTRKHIRICVFINII